MPSTKPVTIRGENYEDIVRVDREGGITQLDSFHAHTHRGEAFSMAHLDQAVAGSGNFTILLEVQSGIAVHVAAALTAGADAQLQFFENTTFSAAGSALPSINRNRIIATPPTTILTLGPTITDDGDVLVDQFVAGGTGGQSPGGSGAVYSEFVLGVGDYLVRMTNLSGQATELGIQIVWYEVEGPA